MRLCPLLDSNQRSNFVRFNPINSMPESTVETACSYCRAAGCGRRNPDLFKKKKKKKQTSRSSQLVQFHRQIHPMLQPYTPSRGGDPALAAPAHSQSLAALPENLSKKKKVRSPRRGSPRRNRRDVQQPAETHAAQRGRRRQNSKHAPTPPPTPGERGNAPLVLEGDEREALRLHLLPPPAAAADGGGGGGVGSVTRERECVCPYGGEEEMWGTRGRPRPKQTDQRPSRNEHVSWVSSLRCLTREEDGMGFGLRRRKASSTGLRDSCDLCPPRPTRRERERGRPRSPISSVRRARERSVARGAPPRVFLRCGWAMAISLDLLQ